MFCFLYSLFFVILFSDEPIILQVRGCPYLVPQANEPVEPALGHSFHGQPCLASSQAAGELAPTIKSHLSSTLEAMT